MNSPLSNLINTWKSLNVLVIGDAMLDCYLNGTSDRLCQEAPVPVVSITQREDFPGGAANVAANVASLGAQVSFLSVVGEDEEQRRLQAALNQRGISTEHWISSPDRTTLAKQRVVANSHLLVRFDQGSVNVIAPDLEDRLIQQLTHLFPVSDAVIVSDYSYGVLTPGVIQTLAVLQNQFPRTLVVDSKQLEAYQTVRVTAVKPNYLETVRFLNLKKQSNERVAQIKPYRDQLLERTGADAVAVTLDSEGVLIFTKEASPLHIPVTPAPANHTSGAGDTFISALTVAIAAQAPTSTAAFLASRATAIVVTEPGTTVCTAEDLYQSLSKTYSSIHLSPAYA